MLEPSTTEGQRVHSALRGLLETAAVQQAKSSASRRRGDASKQPSVHDRLRGPSMHDRLRAPSVHDLLRAPSVHDRLDDQREAQNGHHVGSRRRRHDHDGAARGYQLHRGSRYDSGEDRSPSPRPPGPRVFSKAVRSARFLARFRQPANLSKYSGETNPELWLADYRLAC